MLRYILALILLFAPSIGPAQKLQLSTSRSPLPPGVALIERRSPRQGEIGIPYEKFRMANGLTVILHEDRSDPIVHVDVTYHVGSSREAPGKSGFAHLFEHMMFQGSQHVADEEHFRIVSEAGGTLNGTTDTDRTNYFETVPANYLETVLWLEADRMGFLLPKLTQEKFEIQRATVKNERGLKVDNRPYGRVQEVLDEILFPGGHPYSWPTIGYVKDLDRATINDVANFFRQWYGPNNAVLTIAGDFDRHATLSWVAKYFGSIPRGPDVARLQKATFSLNEDRYVSYKDNVKTAGLHMSWPTVSAGHADEAALDVLMSVLTGSEDGVLNHAILKSGVANNVSGSHVCFELACRFTLSASLNELGGASLEVLERRIRNTILSFEQRGVHQDDLERIRMDIVTSKVTSLQSVASKARQLAYYETFFGKPDLTRWELDRYDQVTSADVMRVYRKYLKNKAGVVLSVLPKDQAVASAQHDNWTSNTIAGVVPREPRHSIQASRIKDNFDRSKRPTPGPVPLMRTPSVWYDWIGHSVRVVGNTNAESPTTNMVFRISTTQRDEPVDKRGITELTLAMLSEATTTSSTRAMSDRLRRVGGAVSFGVDEDYASLSIASLSRSLPETVAIAANKLFSPAFAEQDFQRVKKELLQRAERRSSSDAVLANNARRILLYGDYNAFVHEGGTPETLARISLEDVKSYYSQVIRRARAEVIVVSNMPRQALLKVVQPFVAWTGKSSIRLPVKSFPALEGGTIYLIDTPGAIQSQIRITKRAMLWDLAGDYYKAGVMNFPLGGGFNSRINQKLREEKAYTYNAESGFRANSYSGAFVAGAAVRADATGAAIREFLSVIDAYREQGPTEEELAFAKKSITQREALAYESPMQRLGFLAYMQSYRLSPNYGKVQRAALDSLTLDDMKHLARTYLDTKDMIIVVVGDRNAIIDDLQSLGKRIVDLDKNALLRKAASTNYESRTSH